MPRLEDYRQNLGEVFRLNQFKLTIMKPPAADLTWTDEIMQLKCVNVALPSHTIEPTETDFGRGIVLRDVGRTTYAGDLQTSFKEDVNLNIYSSIMRWMTAIDNLVEGVGTNKEMYQARARVEALNRQEAVIWRREMLGFWPGEVSELSLDSTAVDTAQLDVTWKYDYFKDTQTPAGPIDA